MATQGPRVCMGPGGVLGEGGASDADSSAATVGLATLAAIVGYRLGGGVGLLGGVGAVVVYQFAGIRYLNRETPAPWFCLPAHGR